MSKSTFTLCGVTLVAIAIALAGCCKTADSPSLPVTSEKDSQHDHAMDAHGEHAEALAELSAADRALIEKQKTCPVSGEPLGSMGKPYKVTVKDRVVFLCCKGCEAEIKKNPEKYLAKLPK